MDEAGKIRWGILGDAAINSSFIPGAQAASNATITAIASQRPGNAGNVATRWGIPTWYESYEDLLHDPDIDAVYIPLPNHVHAEWTIRSANAGKHVLCEKPLALSLDEVRAIQDAASRNGVRIMEAFMYRFAPRWAMAEEMTWNGSIGDPRVVRIGFAFYHDLAGYNIRFDPEVGGGIIWDMGCYAVNMARMLLKAEPTSVLCAAHKLRGARVETSVEIVMRFPDDRAAVAHCSFDYTNPYSEVEIVGTEGWMSLPGTGFRGEPAVYILHHHYESPGDEIFLNKAEPEKIEFPWIDPYRLEAEELGEAILEKREPRYGLDDAFRNTVALLAIHESAREHREVPVPD